MAYWVCVRSMYKKRTKYIYQLSMRSRWLNFGEKKLARSKKHNNTKSFIIDENS